MNMNFLDWSFVIAFFAISLIIGLAVSRTSGKSASEFFLSGRSMPWWLLGVSMVATTFSCDTPNLVTDMIRQNGVAGNWGWWAFLLTGMATVFIYARLWRRSKAMTDVEFYELRYSGKEAAFLRGFRAIYLALLLNIVVMASVTLAAIKMGNVMLGLSPLQTILIASVVTVIYSSLGGLKGVLLTDFFQFFIAMFGAIWAAKVAVEMPEIGGLSGLLSHPNVQCKLNLLPDFSNTKALLALFVIPLAVQWWSTWYPGSEPGGGGFIAQRMLSAKDEKNAMGATLLFNAAHYALRPWPWIIVALCSLVIFPDLESLRQAFPNVDPAIVKNDLAYSAMLSRLPHGLFGIVVASLIAAYMSTISTSLNWGSSYIVNDIYRRFINKDASEKALVRVGRITTVLLMIAAGGLALCLQNALQVFDIILQMGAGTGLVFLLRWFWWRISAASEITAMIVSFAIAIYFQIIHRHTGLPAIDSTWQICIATAITTVAWLIATFVFRPTSKEKLREFYMLTKPGGPGWKKVIEEARQENAPIDENATGSGELPLGLLCMAIGCFAIYGTLFATGFWIYGKFIQASVSSFIAICSIIFLVKSWGKFKQAPEEEKEL
jgi:Na+/proline symporter